MGPWSRSFLAAVAGNAERPELEVTNLRIEPGVITATVEGCEVKVSASPIPARTWDSVTRFAAGMGALEDAVQGRTQSVHLEHLLEEDWEQQLIPRRGALWVSCSCDEDKACAHRVAAAFAVAEEFDRSPLSLLRWRGLGGDSVEPRALRDPWKGEELTHDRSRGAMPSYAVLKRLGPSEMHLREKEDLARFLRIAYTALSSPPTSEP